MRRTTLVLRLPWLGWSFRIDVRSSLVSVFALVAAFLVFAWSLSVGDYPVAFTDVLATLAGSGSDDTDFIINTLRLPRGLTGLLVGAGFGVSGAIFQRLARNPLASPDIIGVNAGAATSAVIAIVVLGAVGNQVTAAALVGSAITAISIYLLAYRQGVVGYRLVLVGIGVTAVMGSVTQYLLTRAEIYEAQRAVVWLTGSLNSRGWEHVRPMAVALAVLFPTTIVLARHLKVLELGDETALGLGVRVERARGALLLTGVALAAVGTASAGPISFVALASPQIARRLVRERTLALVPSAALGALVVVSADLVGRRIFAPTELPVGVITAIIGAPYLLVLLARANKVGSGG